MLKTLFTIPKTTNEIVFCLGIFGISYLFLRKKKSAYFQVALYSIIGMLIWRCCFKIHSARYVSVFIYLFTILSAYLCLELFRTRSITGWLFLTAISFFTIVIWTKKVFISTQINSNFEILAQLHNKLNQVDECVLVIKEDQILRMKKIEKNNNPFEPYYYDESLQGASQYILNYRSIGKTTLLNVTLKSEEEAEIGIMSDRTKYYHVMSFFTSKNKKKRQHIYKVETTNAELISLSPNKPIEPESGILENGDLEILDSPEQSHTKFNNHIGDYSTYFKFDQSKRTPVNAYFHNHSSFTKNLPYYSCMNDEALSGKNSAKFITKTGNGSLLFYQKFYSGSYEYSVVFSGKKDTTIGIFYDKYINNTWNINSLATYKIMNKGFFQIKATFSVSGLKPGEFFLVGASVSGEAYLDNFYLKKLDE